MELDKTTSRKPRAASECISAWPRLGGRRTPLPASFALVVDVSPSTPALKATSGLKVWVLWS